MWEYLFVTISKHKVSAVNSRLIDVAQQSSDHDFANKMGEEGWELITVLGDYSPSYLVFKRPKKPTNR